MSDEFYSRVNFSDYANLLKKVTFASHSSLEELTADERYLMECPSMHERAFPSDDPHYLVAILLGFFDANHVVDLDLTPLINRDLWEESYPINGGPDPRVIIIPEGISDTRVLQSGLRLVAPGIAQSMGFLNYDFRPQGGSSNVVNLMKSMAAAGITETILALFDNDAAGAKAHADLVKLKLPSNFMSAMYPDLELARKYPTMGPSGPEDLDVNGRACSIELFVGADCLRRDGRLIPIQWKGYDETMRRYQGEIVDKTTPVEQFEKKVEASRSSGRLEGDWSGIQALADGIYRAVVQNSWN